VIKITSKDFNIDMDKYISKRRTKESSTPKEVLNDMKKNINEWKIFSLFKTKKYEEDYDDEDYENEKYEEEETEIQAIQEIEDELQNKKENIFRKFFKKLRSKKQEEDYEEYAEIEEQNIDEIKEILKITHKWLEELPPEKISQFKRSEDFIKYKQLLKKLEMIK